MGIPLGNLCEEPPGIAGSLCEALKGGKDIQLGGGRYREDTRFINQEWGGDGNERLKIGCERDGNSSKQGEDGSLWPTIKAVSKMER